MEKQAPAPTTPNDAAPAVGISLGVMPVPHGVHLQLHETGTNHVIDFVLNVDSAMHLARTIVQAVQIAENAAPPTFN